MRQQSVPDLFSFSSRLRHLHNIISLLPDKNFNLAVYSDLCGTIGCALGWATQDSAFQAVGFQPATNCYRNSWAPEYGNNTSFSAAIEFFGLADYDTAEYLFSVESYGPGGRKKESHGLYREEFLKRLDVQIEIARIKEYVSHETAATS